MKPKKAHHMRIILTTMTMVYDSQGNILVQDRLKQDWPGINFPGGHVKKDETILASAIREMKEETGLMIIDPLCIGAIEWYDAVNQLRHVCILYRTPSFQGSLKSSSEGRVFWINYKEAGKYKQ